MAVALTTVGPIRCAPGNTVALTGSGFTGATAALLNQGPADPQSGTPSSVQVAVPLTITDDSDCSFVVPDGALTGSLQITGSDGGTDVVTIALIVVSQYVQASEYLAAGEGVDTSSYMSSEIDAVLRRASAYVDAYIGYADEGGMRVMPTVEQHPWRKATRRIYPYKLPIQSVQQFVILIDPTVSASFAPADIVINNAGGYIEILSYAVASYALLGSIENLGFTANIVQLYATLGVPAAAYPHGVREATIMTATELFTYSLIQKAGLGGYARIKQGDTQYDRRLESFALPDPAKEILRPYIRRSIR